MNPKNRNIVLNFLVHSNCHYFKSNWRSKKIMSLTSSQIANRLRALKGEGYIIRYNPKQTWEITDKLMRLRGKL